MKLLFELNSENKRLDLIPDGDVKSYELEDKYLRKERPALPELSEVDLSRHYTELCKQTFGVNNGFYPLGSCTMKYNPRIDEEMASLRDFTDVHPLQGEDSIQGSLEVLYKTQELLCEITGMDQMSLQPAAGAHGEYTGLLLIRRYHQARHDDERVNIIVPDSAHGTNPASAVMAGFKVINVPSNADGGVDLDELRKVVGKDTAGLMLTNPNTLGLFDPNILEITKIIHDAGGLCYYDGANLNAIMGRVRPGDMGFDCIHLNLHKTFGTPHGGGGPGSGPVGCKEFLQDYLPEETVKKEDGRYTFHHAEHSLGRVRSFYGNFLVIVKALTYILTLGREGIIASSGKAVLNANYMMNELKKCYDVAYDKTCMHEFVLCLEGLKKETGVSAMDIAKASLDYGVHPPTMYFPLIVHEALMFEPTETESKEVIDEAIAVYTKLYQLAHEDPEYLHAAPHDQPIGRPNETEAARNPILRYQKEC